MPIHAFNVATHPTTTNQDLARGARCQLYDERFALASANSQPPIVPLPPKGNFCIFVVFELPGARGRGGRIASLHEHGGRAQSQARSGSLRGQLFRFSLATPDCVTFKDIQVSVDEWYFG